MNKYLLIICILSLSNFLVYTQDEDAPAVEIYVSNMTNSSVYARFYPISAVFSGRYSTAEPKFSIQNTEHNPIARIKNYIGENPPPLDYLVGLDKFALNNRGPSTYFEIKAVGNGLRSTMHLDHNTSGSNEADGEFGFGIYQLELWVDLESEPYMITGFPIIFDYTDFNYAYNGTNNMCNDLYIFINSFNFDGISFKWQTGGSNTIEIEMIDLPLNERNIFRCYKQYQNFENNQWVIKSATPNVGTYNHGITKSDELLFPIDGTEINNSDYQIPRHDNPGALYSPLNIDYNHIAKIKCGKTFTIENGAKITLTSTNGGNNYSQLQVGDDPNNNNCGAIFKILGNPEQTSGNYAWLYMMQNCSLIVNKNSDLILERNSLVTMLNGSKIIIKEGGYYCNYGARFGGSGGEIILSKKVYSSHCVLDNINEIYKSTKFILEDSAVYVIPDSSTITFDSTSKFVMKPHSELRFGKNSKIVFENGSSIMCDSAIFTSLDSTETWDGIYLSDLAHDTLKNCTFQNAVNGINIEDKLPSGFSSTPATQITDCIFKNSTSSTLLNYVYINNSTNVLIKGCTSVKTGSGSFTAGIIAEYCTTNGIVIADNNINYVTTGISLLQSSEYIGRNIITGSTNSGTGMYLDNSNGTIEYNIVNNFQKSIYGSYSSPYLLKNTLSNAYVKNIDLVTSSMPVMKPVVSGSTLRWLGGNNTITGTPSHSGICFVDCYPLMDSGYNKITVGGSDYMNGTFTASLTTVNAKLNYWYDSPPNSSLFDITMGSVNYSNPFDGTSLPSIEGTELNSIGWGLYDTVFTKSLGDNSEAEDLFMQAYTEEMASNYTDAIADYKSVVSTYKTSSFSPVSLSRIFNCLGKSNGSSSDYQSIQSYYSAINENSAYPLESRELSEDFMIQAKVRQGYVEDAVSDYDDIYQENTSNAKGTHALINKLCLENMVQGDNSFGSTGNQNHKMDILSLITGEKIRINNLTNNILPSQFKLHQNYPNPFNPITNIKYEIPRDVNVSIKIYDLLGKEVFNLNEYKKAGSYEVQFDGANFASGMYFYQITAGSYTDTKKMVLLK